MCIRDRYEEEGFRYFLLTKECKKENRGKVKVKKWLGITNLKAYEQYISDWHQFLLTCEESIGELEKENIQILTTYILRLFYQKMCIRDRYYSGTAKHY